MKKSSEEYKIPHFGVLFAQAQAKIKFLQQLGCHFVDVKTM